MLSHISISISSYCLDDIFGGSSQPQTKSKGTAAKSVSLQYIMYNSRLKQYYFIVFKILVSRVYIVLTLTFFFPYFLSKAPKTKGSLTSGYVALQIKHGVTYNSDST